VTVEEEMVMVVAGLVTVVDLRDMHVWLTGMGVAR
jgi:hypothetical protein